jgi:hypothetical protein
VREAELSGISVVAAGSFNPAIIHPLWLAQKALLPENVAEHALSTEQPQQLIVTGELTAFVADWLTVQISQEQAVFSTVDRVREQDLRDLTGGIFELLPETPVDALGINSDTHFQLESEDTWHAFGDTFLPKHFWEPIFEKGDWTARSGGAHVGMRSMTVEVNRADEFLPGHVRVELAPSRRVTPNGIYIGINAHFQLTKSKDERGNAEKALRIMTKYWDETRALEDSLVTQLLEAV